MDELQKLKDEILEKFNKNLEEKTKGFLTPEDAEKIKVSFEDTIKKFNDEGVKNFTETIEKLNSEFLTLKEFTEEIKEIAKKQALEIDSLKAPAMPDVRTKLNREEQIKLLITSGLYSKEFSEFKGKGYKGGSAKMTLDNDESGKIQLIDVASANEVQKTVIPITDHTGSVMISEVSNIVRDDTPIRKKHVRDLLSVSSTASAQIVGGQVTDWTDALTLGATVLSENETAPESQFKSEEQTWGLKRIANSMRVSKRWLKVNGLQWVIDHVLARLPDATYNVEDDQLLFGDGVGDNVVGLVEQAQAFDLTPETYIAGAISSVATYNGGLQAMVTFAAAHNILNGDDLVIANAVEATYNATHTAVIVRNATQVIIDVAYVAEADTSVWTDSSQSIFYHDIDNAQEYDVLAVTEDIQEAKEFTVTAHVVNTQQEIQMGLLKATDANYLNIQKDNNGRVVGVNGKPIAVTNAVPAGRFFSGDFSRNGVELREFTPFNIQFAEGPDEIKKNEFVIIVEEEIIYPIYNPFAFIYGKFADAKTELETPAS